MAADPKTNKANSGRRVQLSSSAKPSVNAVHRARNSSGTVKGIVEMTERAKRAKRKPKFELEARRKPRGV